MALLLLHKLSSMKELFLFYFYLCCAGFGNVVQNIVDAAKTNLTKNISFFLSFLVKTNVSTLKNKTHRLISNLFLDT